MVSRPMPLPPLQVSPKPAPADGKDYRLRPLKRRDRENVFKLLAADGWPVAPDEQELCISWVVPRAAAGRGAGLQADGAVPACGARVPARLLRAAWVRAGERRPVRAGDEGASVVRQRSGRRRAGRARARTSRAAALGVARVGLVQSRRAELRAGPPRPAAGLARHGLPRTG